MAPAPMAKGLVGLGDGWGGGMAKTGCWAPPELGSPAPGVLGAGEGGGVLKCQFSDEGVEEK